MKRCIRIVPLLAAAGFMTLISLTASAAEAAEYTEEDIAVEENALVEENAVVAENVEDADDSEAEMDVTSGEAETDVNVSETKSGDIASGTAGGITWKIDSGGKLAARKSENCYMDRF